MRKKILFLFLIAAMQISCRDFLTAPTYQGNLEGRPWSGSFSLDQYRQMLTLRQETISTSPVTPAALEFKRLYQLDELIEAELSAEARLLDRARDSAANNDYTEVTGTGAKALVSISFDPNSRKVTDIIWELWNVEDWSIYQLAQPIVYPPQFNGNAYVIFIAAVVNYQKHIRPEIIVVYGNARPGQITCHAMVYTDMKKY